MTGCFQPHHLTHDLRGLSAEELKVSRDRRYTPAVSVHVRLTRCIPSLAKGLEHWHAFFQSSKKYMRVGRVRLAPIDPRTAPPGPCLTGEQGATAGGEGRGAKPVEDGSGGGQEGRSKPEL